MIYFNVEPEFTHNIVKLLEELVKYVVIPVNIRAAEELTDYAIITRYPGVYEKVTKEKYEQAIIIAQ